MKVFLVSFQETDKLECYAVMQMRLKLWVGFEHGETENVTGKNVVTFDLCRMPSEALLHLLQVLFYTST